MQKEKETNFESSQELARINRLTRYNNQDFSWLIPDLRVNNVKEDVHCKVLNFFSSEN